ncbi:MAG: methyltransferase domain-containing protein [Bacteroidales bacterium]|nr:methyltransferase domain-containing protein [Bacteroidales bacterium]
MPTWHVLVHTWPVPSRAFKCISKKLAGTCAGKVTGIDMTPEMVIRALQNNQKLGNKNVEFVLGEIENMQQIASIKSRTPYGCVD